jgi:hypothetical protein
MPVGTSVRRRRNAIQNQSFRPLGQRRLQTFLHRLAHRYGPCQVHVLGQKRTRVQGRDRPSHSNKDASTSTSSVDSPIAPLTLRIAPSPRMRHSRYSAVSIRLRTWGPASPATVLRLRPLQRLRVHILLRVHGQRRVWRLWRRRRLFSEIAESRVAGASDRPADGSIGAFVVVDRMNWNSRLDDRRLRSQIG